MTSREAWDTLGDAGVRRYLFAAAILFVLDALAYYSAHAIDYGTYLALGALTIALVATALIEVEFYSLQVKLTEVEEKLDELKRLEEEHHP